MSWTIEEYRQEYINNVLDESLFEKVHENEIFIGKIRDLLVNDFSILNDIEPIFVQETVVPGNKFKKMVLSAGSIEDTANTVNLMYADFNSREAKTINRSQITEKARLLVNFFENTLKGFFDGAELTANYYQFARDIKDEVFARKSINKIQLFFATTDYLSERMTKNIHIDDFSFQGTTFEVRVMVIGFSEIYELAKKEFIKEDITLPTIKYGVEGIPCIKADIGKHNYDAYLAIVPGIFLARIYDEYPQQLLEQNVRSFLNTRGKINRAIRNTILSPEDSSNFFIYNNGISATAKEIKTISTNEGLQIIEFTELKIVNGGQTTASLASAAWKDKSTLENIYVQMKLTVTNEQDDDFVHNISKYANSQNAVRQSDLTSNHSIFVRIADLSSKISAPSSDSYNKITKWFFERTRGSYEQGMMKMTKSERERYMMTYPKSQRFTKGDLAKWLSADDERPYDASWGPEVNLTRTEVYLKEQWEKDDSYFNEHFYKTLVAKGILFKKIGETISNQQWYIEHRGYRDKLVPYTFSKIVHEFKKKNYYIDYTDIWLKQRVPDEIVREIEKASKIIFDVLYNPKRQHANIAEYAKREVCWDVAKKVPFTINNTTIDILVTKDELKTEERSAKKERKELNAASAMIDAFEFGSENWTKFKQIASNRGLINSYEMGIIDTVIASCKSGRLNRFTEQKLIEAWTIKSRLEDEGFDVTHY